MSSDLAKAAETAVEQCLRVAPGESVVVVTDDKRAPIGEALYEAVSAITDDATILRYPPADQHGTEPPAPVAAAMAESDAFLAPTTKSLSHTRARGAACDAGARGATLPGITEDVFTTGLDADYAAIDAACDDVLAQVADADEVRVTSPAGTTSRSGSATASGSPTPGWFTSRATSRICRPVRSLFRPRPRPARTSSTGR